MALLLGVVARPVHAPKVVQGRRRLAVASASDGRRGVLVPGGLGAMSLALTSGNPAGGVPPALAGTPRGDARAKSSYASFYELEVEQYGKPVSLRQYDGKVSVVVNVASA